MSGKQIILLTLYGESGLIINALVSRHNLKNEHPKKANNEVQPSQMFLPASPKK